MVSSGAIARNDGCRGFRFERGFLNSFQVRVPNGQQHEYSLVGAACAKSILRFIIVFLALSLSASVARAASVGTVTKVENQAQIGTTPAVVGSPVQMNDELRTGPKSRLEVSFRDNTKLTLGENARVVIDRYVFNPEESTGEFVLSTGVAAFRMATGKIGQMQNKKINVSTPFAALAVRGTDFWWGPIEGQYGALLVSNSRLDVRGDECEKEQSDDDRRRCRCAVILDQSGEGTDIRRRGCPGAPYQWPPGKVAAALASTTFGLAMGPGLLPAAAGAAAVGAAVAATTASDDSSQGSKPLNP